MSDVCNDDPKGEDKPIDELAMQPHVQEVFDAIVKLNMLEIAELSSALQVSHFLD